MAQRGGGDFFILMSGGGEGTKGKNQGKGKFKEIKAMVDLQWMGASRMAVSKPETGQSMRN